MKYLLIFLIFYSSAFAKCIDRKMSDNIKASDSVVYSEVMTSNAEPLLQDGQTHQVRVRVLEILKGPSVKRDLDFSYQYLDIDEPQIKVFKKGEKSVLFLKTVEGYNATLNGVSCDQWGFSTKYFVKSTQIRDDFETALKESQKP